MAASDEFLDDFFAECDEHLLAARQAILELTAGGGSNENRAEQVNTLFRSFHSIKGLSSMVGLLPAEQLAHSLEGFLSHLRKSPTQLDRDGIAGLIDGVSALDAILLAKQASEPLPTIEVLRQRIDELRGGFTSILSDDVEHTASSIPRPDPVSHRWLVTFMPDHQAAAKGINVNAVRDRLSALGKIVVATPEVKPGGQIIFKFDIETTADPQAVADWAGGAIQCERKSASEASPGSNAPLASATHRDTRSMTSHLVRVDVAKLDDLMRLVGDLVITRARLADELLGRRASQCEASLRTLNEIDSAFERQIRDLRQAATRMRLVPLREVFGRAQFILQDLIREEGKSVALAIQGADTEVDKIIVDRVLDPLLHLVRNAISHGLETAKERETLSKPAEGVLRISASLHGEMVQIAIEDDGRGINIEDVQAKARSLGVIAPDKTIDLSNLLEVIGSPGLSTRDTVDRASGRGMGMSAAINAIEQLGGTISLKTTPGQGTRFVIQLPLSLSIVDALVVIVSGRRFVVPQSMIKEIIEIDREKIVTIEQSEMLTHRGVAIRVVRLAKFLGITATAARETQGLVLGEGANIVAIVVERVIGLQEIVVRPLLDPLVRTGGINGATELGDGKLVLIVDPLEVIRVQRASLV